MKTLTVAVIGRNEEEVLGRGLESLKGIADEIVYTDTGGIDKSVDIARSYGSKIYNFPWVDDFGKAYNFCHSKATCDYILMWDTDFVLDVNSRSVLLKLKENNFNNLDSILVKWGLEYDKETGGLQKYIYRDLINKRGEYELKNISHPKVSFFKKDIKKANKDILVHHHQKQKSDINRQDQNIKFTIKDIKDNPEDYTLLLALSGTYIYVKDYEKAFTQLEKFFTFKNLDYFKKLGGLENMLKCCIALNKIDYCFKLFGKYYDEYKLEPAYILLCADLMYFIDKKESLGLYINYIKVRSKKGVHETDIFRNTKHPGNMIEKIKLEIS